MLSALEVTGAADELRRAPAVDGSPVPIALIGLGSCRDARIAALGGRCRRPAQLPESRRSRSPSRSPTRSRRRPCSRQPASAPTPTSTTSGHGAEAKRPPQRIVLHVPEAARRRRHRRARHLDRHRDPHRARPGQHAAVRPLPRDLRRRAPSSSPRDLPVSTRGARRGRPRGGRLRRHPVGRPGIRAPAAPARGALLARRRRAAPRARRQGHHLRLRRTVAQAGHLDAQHEVRHDRCRDRARRRARGRAARPADPRHRVAVPRREHAVRARRCVPATCCAPGTARRSRSLNTDAEGRLVLADGLAAAAAENPDADRRSSPP